MGAPYEAVTVTGYNDNPPPDDGSETEENRVKWETGKEKLADPLKTAIEAVDDNVLAAFAKVIGGASLVSSAVNATVGESDQGKLYRATGAGITITTPDATSVEAPFVFAFLNNSSGTVTLDGNGSQTINGVANVTVPIGGGGLVFTDGTNWFIVGVGGVPAGRQLQSGAIINGTIAESNGSNAVTYSLKTLLGNDPSTDDPVLICFRNATAATGNYVYRSVSAALTLTIPSTATMGASNNVGFDIQLVLFDDGGTIRLGAVNATNLAIAKAPPIASSTSVGTGSDSANVFYTGTGVTSKPYVPLAVAKYPSGLATAGSWNVSPTTLQLYGPDVQAPNGPTQQIFTSGTAATYTTPTGARMLRIRMIGPGGGGGASVTNAGANGSGATIFNSIEAAAGSGGSAGAGAGGAGGTGGAGAANLRLEGGDGSAGSTATNDTGKTGGSGVFGGAGRGGISGAAGQNAKANTGAGGGGGGSGSGGNGGGGGAGEYVELIINGPASSYTYTVGTGGAGGAAGTQAGGNGAAGLIIVDEYY